MTNFSQFFELFFHFIQTFYTLSNFLQSQNFFCFFEINVSGLIFHYIATFAVLFCTFFPFLFPTRPYSRFPGSRKFKVYLVYESFTNVQKSRKRNHILQSAQTAGTK